MQCWTLLNKFVCYMKVQMKNRNKLFVIWTSLNTLFKIMKLTVSYKYDCIFYLLYMLFSTCYIHIAGI